MSDQQATLKFNFDLREVQEAIRSLINFHQTLKHVDDELKDVEESADQTGKEVDELGRKSRQGTQSTERLTGGLRGLARGLGRAAAAGGVAGLAIAGVDNIQAALRTGIDFLRESLTRFAEENETVAARVEGTKQAVDAFRFALADALIGGEQGASIFGLLNNVFDQLRQLVLDNKEQIQNFVRQGIQFTLDAIVVGIDLFGSFLIVLNSLKLVWPILRQGVLEWLNALIQISTFILDSFLGTIQTLTEGLSNFISNLEGIANRIPGINIRFGSITNSLDDITTGANNARQGLNNFANAAREDTQRARADFIQLSNDVADSNDSIRQTTDSVVDVFATLSREFEAGVTSNYVREINTAGEATEQSGFQIESATSKVRALSSAFSDLGSSILSGTSNGFIQARTAIAEAKQELAEFTELIETKTNASLEGLAARSAEMKAKIQVGLTEQFETFKQFADIGARSITGVAEAFGDAVAEGNFNGFGDAVKSLFAGILVDIGKAQISLGAINLIPPPFNPTGNPPIGALQIAAGTAAITLGKAFGGSGGSGGVTPSASGGSASNSGPSTTIINQFGFVGDERRTARIIGDQVGQTNRLGIS